MIFESINHVPMRLRKLRGTPLSQKQINWILERAEQLSTGPEDFSASLTQARQEFMEGHDQKGTFWALKAVG